ncbi:anthranilate phosphoribosyltransferase [Pueribacillus sp. YX66]|uniref:anthranilate phosphoribosyltransferase n=1 Tax=Pueribacillus sp. YX66 TaxID=3229242 RepID=UPI00358D8EEB
MFKNFLQQALNGKVFSEKEAQLLMDEIMSGKATPSQIASLLTIIELRQSTIDEITGFARSMRNHATPVHHNEKFLVDTCGTGGDGSSTFNISTAVTFLLAAKGIPVAKHGNRSVSSKSGSADVLEKLGVPIQSTPEEASKKLKENKMCFLYAPFYHSSMKHAVTPRKEIGFRTVFNILGPMTNPARSNYQLVGVYSSVLAEKMAEALHRLGTKRALLVTGRDGLDECSISSITDIVELNDGKITRYTISPELVGLNRGNNDELKASSIDESATLILQVLKGEAPESALNIVLLNAGAALYTVGVTDSIAEGVHEARKVIKNGDAFRKLKELASGEVQLRAQ